MIHSQIASRCRRATSAAPRPATSLNSACFLPRRLKSLSDDLRKLLGHRDGTHVDNEVIDLAIFVEVHLIDRLKLLAIDLALEANKVPIVPSVSR